MTGPMEIILSHFPSIDSSISDYINGLLEDSADEFESCEDLFEAIGDMLQGCDSDKSENDIQEICSELMKLLHGGSRNGKDSSNGPAKLLGAPVHMAGLAAQFEEAASVNDSIWMATAQKDSVVDQRKLDKANQLIAKKQERRDNEVVEPKKIVMNTASASQQVNRKDNKMESVGSNKTYDVKIENFDISFGDKVLLSGADLQLSFGRRYGLCGRNGIGKTTLLRMMSLGQLAIPSHISVLHVEQEVVGDDTEALQSVLECDQRREGLLRQERELGALLNRPAAGEPEAAAGDGQHDDVAARLSEVYAQLEAIESDKAPARAAMILAGLGFSAAGQRKPTREYSGGWRMRLALARALFTQPDLLLLDEPTNMLDMKAIIWLETYLQTWPTTILCVSHDRQFLNAICTDVCHVHSQRIDSYKGDYDMFVKTREDKLKAQQREYEAQLEYRQHIQVFIDRFRYNANRASTVQSKIKLLEKLPELKPVEKDSEVVLRFPDAELLSPPILQLDELTFHYSKDKPIFKNVCVCAGAESRICIVGDNGAGKTTLLKILLGELTPVEGSRHAHRNLRIGYFSQHHVDQLDMNMNSVEVLAARQPGKPSEFYRHQLGAFGVSGDLATRPVASLSGGQKSRVAFALLAMQQPNFFILDEPTNHLDVESIEALGRALQTFRGGVVLVSHDERLIRMVCEELWVCGEHTVRPLEGGIDEYREIVRAQLEL